MVRLYDGDEDPDDDPDVLDLDDSQLYCPRCGCQHAIKVLTWPVPGSWMRGEGQALCTECDIKFEIRMEIPEEPQPGFGLQPRIDSSRPWFGRR